MKYQVLESLDCDIVICEDETYDGMWRKLMDYRDTCLNNNIDGKIVKNTETGVWEFAWRVARQMNDIDI